MSEPNREEMYDVNFNLGELKFLLKIVGENKAAEKDQAKLQMIEEIERILKEELEEKLKAETTCE